MLLVRETQCAGKSLHDLWRRRRGPALFEPGQIVDGDAGETGELFTAKTVSASSAPDRHADHLRRDAITPAPHRSTELGTHHATSLLRPPGIVVALPFLRQADDCLARRTAASLEA